jgi:hypothetical protein
VIDFFAENALEHERTGEMIERIGLVNFLEGIGLDIDPNMVSTRAPTPTSAPTAGTTKWRRSTPSKAGRLKLRGLTATDTEGDTWLPAPPSRAACPTTSSTCTPRC